MSKDLSVWDMVAPFHAQDALKAAHVECVESFFFLAMQMCAEDTGSV